MFYICSYCALVYLFLVTPCTFIGFFFQLFCLFYNNFVFTAHAIILFPICTYFLFLLPAIFFLCSQWPSFFFVNSERVASSFIFDPLLLFVWLVRLFSLHFCSLYCTFIILVCRYFYSSSFFFFFNFTAVLFVNLHLLCCVMCNFFYFQGFTYFGT